MKFSEFLPILIQNYHINARLLQITLTICNKNLEHMLNKTCHHSDFDIHLIHIPIVCLLDSLSILSQSFLLSFLYNSVNVDTFVRGFSPSLSSLPAIFSLPT